MLMAQAALAQAGWLLNNVQWIVGVAIVVLGLGVMGWSDVARFSLRRMWAISGVCFDESIRRRVLWLTPLAILGIIAVTSLQHPRDAQDDIRQSIKVCLFATALLVTIATIIMACTSLPKEIDNRVIYTIVTKPTTRLEVVVGKVVGFARVSATILLIMGVFSYAYLQFREWRLRQDIAYQLDAGAVDPANRVLYENYRRDGLLHARRFMSPSDLQIYARPPQTGDQELWMLGNGEQRLIVPFELKREDLLPPGAGPDLPPGATGMEIYTRLRPVRGELTAQEREQLGQDPNESPTTMPLPSEAALNVEILGPNGTALLANSEYNDSQSTVLQLRPGEVCETRTVVSQRGTITLGDRLDATQPTRFYIAISGYTPGLVFGVGPEPVTLILPPAAPGLPAKTIHPVNAEGMPLPLRFMGRSGNYGQQLRSTSSDGPLAVYRFRNIQVDAARDVRMLIRTGIERRGDEGIDENLAITDVELTIINAQTGEQAGDPIIVHPENRRPVQFLVPGQALAGGNFDVLMRLRTPGQWLGLTPQGSLVVVADNDSFAWNLFKSLLVLWLMTVLVVIVSIFCSTFLSWPIAVVLSLVILLGRWCVEQVGAGTAGMGASVVTDLQLGQWEKAQVVSRSVEALNQMLVTVARFLPDISRFSATELIEHGVSIPGQVLVDSLLVLGGFGLPILVLAYIFLKNKEVAP